MPYSQCYHHGETIRAYRVHCGMTQAQLAERWPGGAVNPQYVQRVETGKKHITDQETLRQLGALLAIPLWRFGLSEYDPFHPHNLPGHGVRMYQETLDAVECFVRQTWSLRCAALISNADECLNYLNSLFGHFQQELPPPSQLEARFLLLHMQVQRLNAIAYVERKAYAQARSAYATMYATARQLDEPSALALACMSVGSELERAGRKHTAVRWLEQARDLSFQASKHVAAFVQTYLSRVYASAGDALHFERAVATAQSLAAPLGQSYGNGSDFVFGRMSSILAEQSWGYLALGEPRKTLALREEISRQIEQDRDQRLHAWIPLDWARAYLALGEVDASAREAREFYQRVAAMRSPHALRQTHAFLHEAERGGYADAPEMCDFREMLQANEASDIAQACAAINDCRANGRCAASCASSTTTTPVQEPRLA